MRGNICAGQLSYAKSGAQKGIYQPTVRFMRFDFRKKCSFLLQHGKTRNYGIIQ
jgi:hypothetical protein